MWDVTKPETPKQLFTITGLGMDIAHTFTPSPDGSYAVTETEYQYTPLRIWDLEPGQEGKTQNIDLPISAWTADWRDLSHNHEVRWPYVFVSAYEDGLQVFNLKDPKQSEDGRALVSPASASTSTASAARRTTAGRARRASNRARSASTCGTTTGLIVLSDMRSGLWLFKMDGFNGWNGHDYGMPNISSVQDWDHGPEARCQAEARAMAPARAATAVIALSRGARRSIAVATGRVLLRRAGAGPYDIALFATPQGARGAGQRAAGLRRSRRSASR